MKTLNTILKIVAALVAIAGIVYIIVTYGDKIAAWAKEQLAKCPCCSGKDEQDAPVEEAEEAPAEEEAAPVEEAFTADESDFVG